MWIKILTVVSILAIAVRADISELSSGYSYNRPESVPAELAYYQRIPAGQPDIPFIANNQQHHHLLGESHHGHGNSHFNQPSLHELVSKSISENQHQFHEPENQYIPPEQKPSLPFIRENSGFRPSNFGAQQFQNLPFIQENTGLNLVNSPSQQLPSHQPAFIGAPHHHHQTNQVEPRNQNQLIPQNTLNFLSHHHGQNPNSQVPSQKFQPSFPPIGGEHQPSGPSNRFMASISSSYNAPLPFPFGVVPLKFEPLPLKTHLRQEKLLPITSYEAKRFYKK